jgi:hypothetical protein
MAAHCYQESKRQPGVCKWWVVPPRRAAFCVSPANPERQPCPWQGQGHEPAGESHPCSDFQRATDGNCRNWLEPRAKARTQFKPFCARYPDEVCLTDGRPWEETRLAEERALLDKALERLADRGLS